MPITCVIHSGTPLVCPKCLAAERGRKGGRNKRGTGAVMPVREKAVKKPSIYTTKDCLSSFEAEPRRDFNCAALVQLAAEEKRENARIHIGHRVQYLYMRGRIDRVGEGEYRLTQNV